MTSVYSRFFAFITILLASISFSANALNESYQLFSKNGDYYLKADPTWVPISGEIFVIIPVYGANDYIKLTENYGTWSLEVLTQAEFETANPSVVAGSAILYSDLNADGITDITLNFGSGSYFQPLELHSNSSGGYAPLNKTEFRRVIFVHTDLLGSPVAETKANPNPQN